MLKISAIFLAIALAVPCYARNALTGEFPAQVALQMPANRFGEAVILNQNHVLTVATNVVVDNVRLAPELIEIRAGVISLAGTSPIIGVIRVYVHENFNRFTLESNLAVLRAGSNFDFQPNVAVPTINPAELYDRIIPDGAICDLVGWNVPPNHNTITKQVHELAVMNRDTCNALPNIVIQGTVYDEHICVGTVAGNPGVCNANGGGGYYCDGQLSGLFSSGRECGQANSPAVVVQVRWHMPWIQRQFTRNDLTPPAALPPPGTLPDSATSVILSTALILMALSLHLFAL